MTEEPLLRSSAVLTRMSRDAALEAGRAWASLAVLAVCIAFWVTVALFVL
jgi:hypothetical protein